MQILELLSNLDEMTHTILYLNRVGENISNICYLSV